MSEILSRRITQNLNEGLIKEWLDATLPGVVGFLWSVILALIVYWIGQRIINMIRRGVKKAMTRRCVEEGVRTFTDSLIRLGLNIALFVCILGVFGIKSTSIAATVAALGLTAGLSLQGSLSNFAGGVLILVLKPFVVGDYIIEDTGKNEGTVVEISIFYTKLRTMDHRIVMVPNGNLSNSALTNVTSSGMRRQDITIGISYDSDIRTAKAVLQRLVDQEERRLNDQEVNIFVRELNDSSVDMGVRFYVKTEDYWAVRWKFLEDAKYAFDEAGILIPYPQLDVHMESGKEELAARNEADTK